MTTYNTQNPATINLRRLVYQNNGTQPKVLAHNTAMEMKRTGINDPEFVAIRQAFELFDDSTNMFNYLHFLDKLVTWNAHRNVLNIMFI